MTKHNVFSILTKIPFSVGSVTSVAVTVRMGVSLGEAQAI